MNAVDLAGALLQWSYASSDGGVGVMSVAQIVGFAFVGSDFAQPSASLQLASLGLYEFGW